jgi:integrase
MSRTSSDRGARQWRAEPSLLPVVAPPSGHVFCVQRQRGLVWYAKYRTGTGRQIQKKLGPAWTRRGRPPAGYVTRSTAERWLCATLEQIRARTQPPMAGTRATFEAAAAEWLRHVEDDRGRKPNTIRGYEILLRVHLLPEFEGQLLTEISTEQIERWVWGIQCSAATRTKLIVCLSGIYHRARRVWGISYDPVDEVQRPLLRASFDIAVYTPGEVQALVVAARNEQDAALLLTAAFTGLRLGELVALRWRDVDLRRRVLRVRGSWSGTELALPKAGRVRSVPLAPQVTTALSVLLDRGRRTTQGDLVFAGVDGGYLDRSALRRRYRKAQAGAGLRPLRFHDLRHTFATTMIARTSIRRVQEWMGHSDLHSTMRYLHYAPRDDDARLVAEAFAECPALLRAIDC